jgi:hypothetical protein
VVNGKLIFCVSLSERTLHRGYLEHPPSQAIPF